MPRGSARPREGSFKSSRVAAQSSNVVRRHANRYAFTVVGCFHKRDAPRTPRGWRTLQRESREPSSKMEKLLRRVPDPVVYVAGAVAAVFAALKVKAICERGLVCGPAGCVQAVQPVREEGRAGEVRTSADGRTTAASTASRTPSSSRYASAADGGGAADPPNDFSRSGVF